MDKTSIVLGSGHIYIMEYDGSDLPENTIIEAEEYRLGYISGGATIEYQSTHYEAKDDLGKVSKSILTEEEVTLKTGIITWCAESLEKLCGKARITEEHSKRIAKIGGVGNYNGKKYVIHFHHEDTEDGDIRITIVGNNQAGFSLAFAKDAATTVDAEFKAMPMDEDGTLIYYEEDILTEDASSATEEAEESTEENQDTE